MRVFRGLRHRDAVDLTEENLSEAFLSTTLDPDVAIEEFAVPPGAAGGAVLELEVPRGTQIAGTPAVRIVPRRQRTEAGILIVDCEVQT